MEFGTKKLGFGFMRLPMIGEEVDIPQCDQMVDLYMQKGFRYFDTARPYLKGKSELALKECLTSRYPREDYFLVDKLSHSCFSGPEEIAPFLDSQLEALGVDHLDLYLLHAMDEEYHEEYLEKQVYPEVRRLKETGKFRHLGMSFHDSAQVLDRILTDLPEIEVVQIQLNYLDMEDPRVQSRACYEVCRKHGKPILIMEPVKGGALANIPADAAARMTGGSPASYAIRFCASLPGVAMVLSGMSTLSQVEDNVSFMESFQPLTEAEQEIVSYARTAYQAQNKIPCTACRYCTDGCPASIDIPAVFAAMNDKTGDKILEQAKACVGCGQCEAICPQKLQIRALLEKAGQ